MRTRSLGAFHDDPGVPTCCPDPSDRTRAAAAVLRDRAQRGSRSRTGSSGRPTSVVGGGDLGAAGSVGASRSATTLREAPPMVRVFGRRLPLALRSRLRMEGRHPRRPPHWYLAIMGVAPEWQGRGLGTALMSPALEALDAAGTPAYLEASTPAQPGAVPAQRLRGHGRVQPSVGRPAAVADVARASGLRTRRVGREWRLSGGMRHFLANPVAPSLGEPQSSVSCVPARPASVFS